MMSASEIPLILIGLTIVSLMGALSAAPSVIIARWRRKRGAHAVEFWIWNFLAGLAGTLVPAIVGMLIGASVPDENAGEAAIFLAMVGALGGCIGAAVLIAASALKPPRKSQPDK